jgi:hypothetical protein
VTVDPAEYRRRPREPERPLRTLPFGQARLATFLTHEPDCPSGCRPEDRRGQFGGQSAARGSLSWLVAASGRRR